MGDFITGVGLVVRRLYSPRKFLSGALGFISALSMAEAEVYLDSYGDWGVRLVCVPGRLEWVKREDGTIPVMEGAVPSARPGAPMVPIYGVRVALPPEGRVWLEGMSMAGSEVIRAGKLLPCPEVVEGGRFGKEVYKDDPEIYRRDALWPKGPVMLRRSQVVRGLRTAFVEFYPLRYNPVREEVVLCTRIEVTVRFDGKKSGRAGDASDRALLESIVINPEQAVGWFVPRRARRPSGSPFRDGTWIKIGVKKEGMYKVTGSELRDVGVSLEDLDPRTVKVFYGGGLPLPTSSKEPRPKLREVSIWVEDGGDGRLDGEDYVLFYGEPVDRWVWDGDSLRYVLNPYTSENVYWLTFGGREGRRMEVLDGSLRPAEVRGTYRERVHREVERYPLYERSGTEWYWEVYRGDTKTYSFLIYDAVSEDSLRVRVFFRGPPCYFRVFFNGSFLGRGIPPKLDHPFTVSGIGRFRDGVNTLTFSQIDSNKAKLDWVELEYTRRLVARDGRLFFTVEGTSGPVNFRVERIGDGAEVFRVTDPWDVGRVEGMELKEGVLTFGDSLSGGPVRYLVLGPSEFSRPDFILRDRNSDLRGMGGADYIVIAHRDLLREAEELVRWREERGMRAIAVDVEDVYDEFAWGLEDPTAMRDFLKYAYEVWNPRPSFALLFGNGHFDFRNRSGSSPPELIPPYEEGALESDLWFGCVDGEDLLPDIAVGRLPVTTPEEARTVVEKIKDYESRKERGPWQDRVILVGDDEWGGIWDPSNPSFTRDTEIIARYDIPSLFNQVKIYLMEYPRDSSGEKPQAREALIREINRGAILCNYIGHGNYDVLAHEHVLRGSADVGLLENGRKLPFFFFSSCSNAHFDDPVRLSISERLLLSDRGGGIGVIAAARKTFHEGNVALNRNFYRVLFGGRDMSVGMAFVGGIGRLSPDLMDNARKFVLLGDPALSLAMPELEVRLSAPDSIKALAELKVSGEVYRDGELAKDFRGEVLLEIFDSANMVRRRLGGITLSYLLPGVPLFRGVFPVEGGRFVGAARMPKAISYGEHLGRISAFVWGKEGDGAGLLDSLFVGGTGEASVDREGPRIRIGFEGQEFADGDFVPSSCVLVAELEDESGINITGELGHDIEAWVDGRNYKLTDSFVAQGDYRKGKVRLPLRGIRPGLHRAVVKAWDIFNNPSEAEVTFRVAGEVEISDVLCYPNPMDRETTFTFVLSGPARVRIRIYTLSGRLVDTLEGEGKVGFNTFPWRPRRPLAGGVYIFKVEAEAEGGKASCIEKLAVYR